MKRWLIIAALLLVSLVPTSVVFAATTADVTITASGYIVEAPGGLTLTYVSDYELGISWTKGSDADNTMVRVKYGNFPEDRNDGYLVYHGVNATTTDSNVILASPEIPYYRAWSQRADGVWEELGTTAEAFFMSISFLFVGLLVLGLGLFVAAFRWKDILLSYAAALTWMAIGFWWVVGDITNFGLSESWSRILIFVPFILSFTVLLRLMNTEILMESKGKKWTEWGSTPKEEAPSRRDEYRKELRRRSGR